MSFMNPAAFWFSLLAGAIMALYILKPRRRRQPVSSTLLWERVAQVTRAASPWQRLRANLLLFLQLAAIALMITALAYPFFALGPAGRSIIIVIDDTASMAATDIQPHRLEAAKKRAIELVSGLSPRDRVAVVSAAGPEVIAPWTVVERGVVAAIDKALEPLAPRPGGALDPKHLVDLVNGLALGADEAIEVTLIGDGGYPGSGALSEITAPVIHIPIGLGGDLSSNLALVGLETSSLGGTKSALVLVGNYSSSHRQVELILTTDTGESRVKEEAFGPGEEKAVLFSGLSTASHRVVVEVRPAADAVDHLIADNIAYNLAETAIERQVLMVTAGNVFLDRALLLSPDVKLFKASPEQYRRIEPEALGRFDLIVFDDGLLEAAGAASQGGSLPATNFLALGIGPNNGLLDCSTELEAAAGSRVEISDHPVTAYADFGDVAIARARPVLALNGHQVVAWAQPEGDRPLLPLIVVGQVAQGSTGSRFAALTFRLADSNLALRPAFPILIQNLLDWVAPPSAVGRQNLRAGEAVALQLSGNVTRVEVTTPGGVSVTVFDADEGYDVTPGSDPDGAPGGQVGQESPRGLQRIFTETGEAGFYKVMEILADGRERVSWFAASFREPAESNLAALTLVNPGEGETAPDDTAPGETGAGPAATPTGKRPLTAANAWRLMALLALAVVFTEWLVDSRGV